MTGGADSEPPDDDSMGGGDESEQSTRKRCIYVKDLFIKKKKHYVGLRKEANLEIFISSLTFTFLAFAFSSVSAESTQEDVKEGSEAKDISAIGQGEGL